MYTAIISHVNFTLPPFKRDNNIIINNPMLILSSYSCRHIGSRFQLWFCPLGSRHMGLNKYSHRRQSFYPSLQRASCGSYCHNKAWSHWNQWWQLLVDPSRIMLHVLPIFNSGSGNNTGVLWDRLFPVHIGCLCNTHQSDSQVVPHLLWFALLGPKTTRLAHHLATETSSYSPCFSW